MIRYQHKIFLSALFMYAIFLILYSISLHPAVLNNTMLINIFWFSVVVLLYYYTINVLPNNHLILYRYSTMGSALINLFLKLSYHLFVYCFMMFLITWILFVFFNYSFSFETLVFCFLNLFLLLMSLNISFLSDSYSNLKHRINHRILTSFILIASFMMYPAVSDSPWLAGFNIVHGYYSLGNLSLSSHFSVLCFNLILLLLLLGRIFRKWQLSL